MKSIYAIWDNKAQAIVGPLNTHTHVAIALREFAEIITDENPRNQIRKYPSDFDLVCIGHLNDHGEFRPLAGLASEKGVPYYDNSCFKHELITNAATYVAALKQDEATLKLEK